MQKLQQPKSLEDQLTPRADESEDHPAKDETKAEDLTISTLMNVLKRR
jgi:hypothetical protein